MTPFGRNHPLWAWAWREAERRMAQRNEQLSASAPVENSRGRKWG